MLLMLLAIVLQALFRGVTSSSGWQLVRSTSIQHEHSNVHSSNETVDLPEDTAAG